MALPRVSSKLPPYDPKKSTLAFGNGALPKLVSWDYLLFAIRSLFMHFFFIFKTKKLILTMLVPISTDKFNIYVFHFQASRASSRRCGRSQTSFKSTFKPST